MQRDNWYRISQRGNFKNTQSNQKKYQTQNIDQLSIVDKISCNHVTILMHYLSIKPKNETQVILEEQDLYYKKERYIRS